MAVFNHNSAPFLQLQKPWLLLGSVAAVKAAKLLVVGARKFRICHARIYATVEKVVTIGMIIPLRTSIYQDWG
jgi:hypothetical protein